MTFAAFTCAMGDSPAISLPAAATVNLSPADGSGDANRIIITGSGTINSFGDCYNSDTGTRLGDSGEIVTVTKHVTFLPDAGQTITLHQNSPLLCLLGQADRVISGKSFGVYQADTSTPTYWQETQFAQDNRSPVVGGGLIDAIYYAASQTITIPVGAHRAWVRMWGGTGASGAGGAPYGYAVYAPGTGAAGYLEKLLKNLTPGNTLIFTRGTAGVVGATSPGNNGTASTLASGTQTIGTLTANGSNGSAIAGLQSTGTPGGTATGGDINVTGQSGGSNAQIPVGDPAIGAYMSWQTLGGSNFFSKGADGGYPNGNPGTPGGLIIFWLGDQ